MGCLPSKTEKKDEKSKEKEVAPKTASQDQEKRAAKEENKDFSQTMVFLSKVQLFKLLPRDEQPILAAACEPVVFPAGKVVITQGQGGADFYVIKSGQATVTVQIDKALPQKVAVLKGGDYFGEGALLRDEPRAATVTAETELKTLKISRQRFQELGLNEKLHFPNRKAVGGGGAHKLEVKPPTEKNHQEREQIASALRRNENLQTMATLDADRVKSLIDIAWKEEVPAGKDIITEGDLVADYFYVVREGSFEIYVFEQTTDQPQSAEKVLTKGESKFVSTVSEGGSFGELALLYLVPRAATVKAKVDSVVWVFDRQNFKNILMKASTEKIDEYVTYLNRVEILAPLLADEKKALAQALVEMHFAQGEVVLQQGQVGNTFYILYEGEVEIVKDGHVQTKLSGSKTRNEAEFFGERALLNSEPRAATVRVVSETAKALALDRDAFNLLLGPLEDIIKRSADGTPRQSLVGKGQLMGKPNDRPHEKIFRKDLVKIGLLGCGGFGAVELWEHRHSKQTYAMKALSKGYVVKTGMQESVMNERNILLMTNSPFIIKLWETYNGAQTLYFLLEPALGGELYATYNRKGFHGSEKHATFYAAGTLAAFEHIHTRRIIYRDLKPENLLLNEHGQPKLTDMGFAKFVIGKTYTTCGTPDYFAPELIASSGHTNAVDWWTMGILIFELMSGHPPFESEYPMQIYAKVMKGIGKIQFPPKCQGPVGELIKDLLKQDPSERLPMRPGGVSNVKKHKWYSGFDWQQFESQRMTPPYTPVVKSKKDIRNFAARKEDMPKPIEYRDDGSGWDKDFASA